jgi:hypothetical protein
VLSRCLDGIDGDGSADAFRRYKTRKERTARIKMSSRENNWMRFHDRPGLGLRLRRLDGTAGRAGCGVRPVLPVFGRKPHKNFCLSAGACGARRPTLCLKFDLHSRLSAGSRALPVKPPGRVRRTPDKIFRAFGRLIFRRFNDENVEI